MSCAAVDQSKRSCSGCARGAAGGRRGGVRGQRAKAAVFALRRNGRIFLGGHEAHVVELQRLQIDGFLNQVAVLVADVLELRRRHAHIERAAGCVAVASGFEPGLEGLADHLLFQCRENLEPGVESRCRRSCKCHRSNPCLRRLVYCRNGSSAGFGQRLSLGAKPWLAVRVCIELIPDCRWSAPGNFAPGRG